MYLIAWCSLYNSFLNAHTYNKYIRVIVVQKMFIYTPESYLSFFKCTF